MYFDTCVVFIVYRVAQKIAYTFTLYFTCQGVYTFCSATFILTNFNISCPIAIIYVAY
jgi:hypothetical protein